MMTGKFEFNTLASTYFRINPCLNRPVIEAIKGKGEGLKGLSCGQTGILEYTHIPIL